MKKHFIPLTHILLILVTCLAGSFAWGQTSPESFLGFPVGADKKLADYDQLKAYLEKLDQESPQLSLFNIGPTTLGKQMVMAAISSEENLKRLDHYKGIAKRLRDPRGLPVEEAQKLAREGKVILLITCSLHASEVAASQMSLELAYKLAIGKTPFDAKQVLKDVIILIIPTINPDGHHMVTEWYRKNLGSKFEGGSMPWLYHHYAGHDDNRDWFMFNLAETRAVTKVLHQEYFPQVNIDEHQMGSTGARLFLPPYMDPPVGNVDPLVFRSVNLLGTAMAYDLQKQGYKGLVNGRIFTGWWIGSASDTSWLHGVVGILSEMASCNIASPIYIEPGEIPLSYAEKRMEFFDPWPGGWWRLRDLVDYELALSFSLINNLSRFREDFLFNSYQLGKRAVEVTEKGQPFAFVIPTRQHDQLATLKMLDVLMFGGVEIQQAKADFIADGKVYPAGSYVVSLAQPVKPYAWALLDKQEYPNLREYAGGPPVPPYDNAGWTLPLQMGVTCDRIATPFEAKLEKLAKVVYPKANATTLADNYIAIDSRNNGAFAVAANLLKDKAEVWRTTQAVKKSGLDLAAGSFVIKKSAEVGKNLPALLDKHHLQAVALASTEGLPLAEQKRFRVGLYQSWRGSMDEGWTRYVLDDLGIAYTTLHNDRFKAEKDKKVDLRADFDAIIFADENSDIIKTGKPAEKSEGRSYNSPLPAEYEGGIEKEGVDALRTFVEQGGVLVLLNRACELAFKDLDVPARNAIDKIDRAKFFCPTSIVNVNVDNASPIGWGMPEHAAVVFANSLAMETWVPPADWNRKVVAAFPEKDVLASGWLLGGEYVARKAAVVDTSYKKGHIVLIGIRAQHRAQAHGAYKFLLNGLLYPEEKK